MRFRNRHVFIVCIWIITLFLYIDRYSTYNKKVLGISLWDGLNWNRFTKCRCATTESPPDRMSTCMNIAHKDHKNTIHVFPVTIMTPMLWHWRGAIWPGDIWTYYTRPNFLFFRSFEACERLAFYSTILPGSTLYNRGSNNIALFWKPRWAKVLSCIVGNDHKHAFINPFPYTHRQWGSHDAGMAFITHPWRKHSDRTLSQARMNNVSPDQPPWFAIPPRTSPVNPDLTPLKTIAQRQPRTRLWKQYFLHRK